MALRLGPKDLDSAAGAIRVLFGKRGRSRTVRVDAGAFGMIGEWLAERAKLIPASDAPLARR